MQNIFANVIAFVIREWRSLLAIGIFVAIVYVLSKLSEKEWYYRWLIRINPKDAQAHYNLGNLLEDLPNRKAEAEKEFQQVVALRPGYSWGYYSLYYIQADEQKFEEAQKTLEDMITRFPEDGITFGCQANLYYRQGLFQ